MYMQAPEIASIWCSHLILDAIKCGIPTPARLLIHGEHGEGNFWGMLRVLILEDMSKYSSKKC
jgi:hypothetical protein